MQNYAQTESTSKVVHRVKYEHPLNEHTRMYLRIEFLLKQIKNCIALEYAGQHRVLLTSIIELLELCDQVKIKNEIIKDLEKHKNKLKKWLGVAKVNQDLLKNMLKQITEISEELLRLPRIDADFLNDRLLTSVRQRMSIPGGCCSFDVPMLHCWLHKSQAEKQHFAYKWWSSFEVINEALTILLKMLRESGQFMEFQAVKGFYQGSAEKANLLRIEIPVKYNVYPVVSGNKNRFSIRFMNFAEDESFPDIIDFKLALCK